MSENVFFENSRGNRLSGALRIPPSEQLTPVVVCAGMGGRASSYGCYEILDALMERGVATFSFDFSEHAPEMETPGEELMLKQADELKHAVSFVRERGDIGGRHLVVSSFDEGCACCLYVNMDIGPTANLFVSPRLSGENSSLRERAGRITAPTLFIQGSADPYFAETEKLFMAMRHTSGLRIIEGAGHFFSNKADLELVVTTATEWITGQLTLVGKLA